jgi:hypothetical protein
VLSIKEAEKKFGLPLHKKNIQPVWVRLTNNSTNDCSFLPAAPPVNRRCPAVTHNGRRHSAALAGPPRGKKGSLRRRGIPRMPGAD